MHHLAVSLTAILAWTLAAADFPLQRYKSQDFTAPAFKVKRSGQATADGRLFLGYFKSKNPANQSPMIFENNGDLVWHGNLGAPVYNFRRQTLNKNIVLTYWTGFLDYQGHGYGHVKILDKDYNEMTTVCLPDDENSKIVSPRPNQYPGNMTNACFVDKHESYITDEGTILITAYNATQTDLRKVGGDADGWVFDCLFYEMDVMTQEIKFKWSALDHVKVTDSHFINKGNGKPLDLNGRTYGSKRQPWDFFHINSVQKVDGGYLLNSRMTWAMYKINNKGKKIWTLEGSKGGDFKLDPGISWSWQHMPRLDKDVSTKKNLRIGFFNNNNIQNFDEGKVTSNGYYLDVNLKTKRVKALKDLIPAKPLYGVAEGSWQSLEKNHALVGFGAVPVVEEYVGGKRIYHAQFGPINPLGAHSYRAYRFPWTAQPSTPPSAAAEGDATSVTAYMSWNGATTYDSWNIYAGRTKKTMKRVAHKVSKKGFETSKTFKMSKKGYKYVQVEALAGKKSLGKSNAVAIDLPASGGGGGGGGNGNPIQDACQRLGIC